MTLELMDDVAQELKKHENHSNLWMNKIAPSAENKSAESEAIACRLSDVFKLLLALSEVSKKSCSNHKNCVFANKETQESGMWQDNCFPPTNQNTW